MITAGGVIEEIFIPSLVSMIIPALIMQTQLKGELDMESNDCVLEGNASQREVMELNSFQRKMVFFLGV